MLGDTARTSQSPNQWACDKMQDEFSATMSEDTVITPTLIPESYLMLRPTEFSDGSIVWFPTRNAIRGELERCGQYDHDDEDEAERMVDALFFSLKPVRD